MPGGFHQSEVSEESKGYLNANVAAINHKLGVHHDKYEIKEQWSQVVAGTNYFYHVHHGDDKYSVLIHVPLPHTGEPAILSYAKPGYHEPSHE